MTDGAVVDEDAMARYKGEASAVTGMDQLCSLCVKLLRASSSLERFLVVRFSVDISLAKTMAARWACGVGRVVKL